MPGSPEAARRTSPALVWLYWAAVALPPAVVYWRTMAPGLLARGDVPKFQFLGAMLGTAHTPGYPLFIELSWLFSQIPIGTVAWRVNLLTMVFGVVSAACAAWAARECGANRTSALLAAWGLAFGAVFWEQATAAEVYTLAAAFQLATIALVVRWSRTRRDRHVFGAIAVACFALGHHPSSAMVAPSLALFVLVVDWRVILRPRVVLGTVVLFVLGLAQYGYVIARSRQGAPFLEARASSLGDVLALFSGDQYSNSIFAFSGRTLLFERVPFVWHLFQTELTATGVLLTAVGLWWLARHKPHVALLLAGSGVTVYGFAASYDVGDVHVFAIPVFVVAWIAAAVGLTRAAALARTPAAIAAAGLLVSVGLGATMVARGFDGHDLSDERRDRIYFDALLEQIETPFTFLFDRDDPSSHALRYKLLVDRAALGRARVAGIDDRSDPQAHLEPNRTVYAFDRARTVLETRGLLMAPVFLDASLVDRLPLPAGAVVAVALSPDSIAGLGAEDARFFREAGMSRFTAGVASVLVARNGATVAERSGASVVLTVPVGSNDTSTIDLSAGNGSTMISTGGRTVTGSSALIAVVASDGAMLWHEDIDRRRGTRPTIDRPDLRLFRAVGTEVCQDAEGPDWARFDRAQGIGTRVSEWIRGTQTTGRPVDDQIELYLTSDDAPVRVAGQSLEGGAVSFRSESIDRGLGDDDRAVQARFAADGIALPGRFVTRITHPLTASADSRVGAAAVLAVAPRPLAVAARAVSGKPSRFCLPPVRGAIAFGDPSQASVELVRGESEAIGEGWHDAEGDGASRLRWTSASRADVRLSVAAPLALVATIEAGPQRVQDGDRFALEVNGHALGAQPLRQGTQVYTWSVPASVITAGFNVFTLVGPSPESPASMGAGSDTRPLGLGVRGFVLERSMR